MPLSEPMELLPPLGGSQAAAEAALKEVERAVDDAVRSIFELARSLEFLTDAIGGLRDETRRQLEEWQDIRAGAEDAARPH